MFGSYKWADTYLNAVWFNNAMQVSLMAGLKAAGREPYNQEGHDAVYSWLQDPVARALNTGVIDTGIPLSAAQANEVNSAAGLDITGQLFTNGYYIQVKAPAPAVRGQRQSPIVNVWYTYGGSIHKLVVSSNAIV
jgi:hypothetical protein